MAAKAAVKGVGGFALKSRRCRLVVCLVIIGVATIRQAFFEHGELLGFWNETKTKTMIMTTTAAAGTTVVHDGDDNTIDNTIATKPYFIVHVGPIKTATTSLQISLQTMQDKGLLQQDNYVYAGVRYRLPYDDERRNPHGNSLFDAIANQNCQRANSDPLADLPACWQTLERDLKAFRRSNTSVILSREILSVRPNQVNWRLLQHILVDQQDWNLVVVVAYRRLTEWLPSLKQQQDRWRPSKPQLNKWPVAQGGRRTLPLFPHVIEARQIQQRPALSMVHWFQTQRNITVKLMNLHKEDDDKNNGNSTTTTSVLTLFLCHVVPNAPVSCAASRARDANPATAEVRANPEISIAYDLLVCEAEIHGVLVNATTTQWNRHEVVLAVQRHQEEVLGLTVGDFDVQCPSQDDLETLLNASLAAEAETLPDFYARHEETHRSTFWKAARETKKYCWIDSAKVLAQETWIQFFQNLTKQKVLEREEAKR